MRILLFCLTFVMMIFSVTNTTFAQKPDNTSANIDSSGCQIVTGNNAGWIRKMLEDCAGNSGVAIDSSSAGDKKWFQKKVIKIAEGVLGFAALFAIGAIVYAGFLYVTAYGSDQRLQNAKSVGKFAVIGLILALASFSLVEVLVKFIYSLPG